MGALEPKWLSLLFAAKDGHLITALFIAIANHLRG
jgi:hypothetical protein